MVHHAAVPHPSQGSTYEQLVGCVMCGSVVLVRGSAERARQFDGVLCSRCTLSERGRGRRDPSAHGVGQLGRDGRGIELPEGQAEQHGSQRRHHGRRRSWSRGRRGQQQVAHGSRDTEESSDRTAALQPQPAETASRDSRGGVRGAEGFSVEVPRTGVDTIEVVVDAVGSENSHGHRRRRSRSRPRWRRRSADRQASVDASDLAQNNTSEVQNDSRTALDPSHTRNESVRAEADPGQGGADSRSRRNNRQADPRMPPRGPPRGRGDGADAVSKGGSESGKSMALECAICLDSYNTHHKKPLLCVSCGNSQCAACCAALLKTREPKCPHCRATLAATMPTNVLVMQLL